MIVLEEARYLLEWVRYLHRNPLRAGTVPTLVVLDRDPWSGHSALLGTVPRPWLARGAILAQAGPARRRGLAHRGRWEGLSDHA